MTVTIDRCVYGHVREEVLECLLHGFADASKKAAQLFISYTGQRQVSIQRC